MSEKMIVLSKRLKNRSSQAFEKKLNKEIGWANPMIFISEEVEIIVNLDKDEDLKEVVERVKEVAGKEYEVEIYEP